MNDNNLLVYLNTLRQKGYLAYEYNPFYNYQTDVDLYEVDTDIGKVKVPKGLAVNLKNGLLLTEKGDKWVDNFSRVIDNNNVIIPTEDDLIAKVGSLVDLDTEQLNFDLEHPVDITVQPSYDGSVNLILNDDKNIPRLINSRFSAREKGTYEIVDRIGENDTNIYNSKTFDKDTSLYFLYEYNPEVLYLGFINGVLPVGQYCFYFTYCDSDDNESDYIAETGVIPVFIGTDCDPNSIDGGIKNQISNKGIRLKLTNIDKSYNYFKVYYVRYFADYLLNRVYECKKIYKKFPINSNTVTVLITGNEEAEDLDANILNISRFNPRSILTQAQCKNMLFFGNIVKNSDNYRELRDCALRIIPLLEKSTINVPDNNYRCSDPYYGYYSSLNMYNKVGYFNNEYYRFGVVFIYLNGTLSNVYNTLGGTLVDENTPLVENNWTKELFTLNGVILTRNYIKIDDEGWIAQSNKRLNSRGVCYINKETIAENEILGIKFNIPQEVLNYLKEDLGIRGLFFVRLKCVPNMLALCYILPMDEYLKAPVIVHKSEGKTKYTTECFVSLNKYTKKQTLIGKVVTEITGGRYVVNDYESRLFNYELESDESKTNEIQKSVTGTNAYAAICPDFLLNQPYYNQIFNGNKFSLELVTENASLVKNNRFYIEESVDTYKSRGVFNQVTVCTVTEDVPSVALEDKVYKLKIGEQEEAFKFEYAGIDNGTYSAGDEDFDAINNASNLVRGMYSPYLAIYSDLKLNVGELYNIYLSSNLSDYQEFKNRMDSSEPFYAISNRYNFDGLATNGTNRTLVCWKGDCYINTFTYRLNRNFNDPSLPNNDKIIDKNTWRENYNAGDSSNWNNISRSDLNAVQMGSWITFKVRSAMNYALRSEDNSYVSEKALMGSPRTYYPRNKIMWRGTTKLPDSYLYNDAYRASLGFKCYFTNNDINYIKDTFSNRIQYSAISILDSFKNNFRYSLSTYFRDYSQEYGSIQKLVGFEGYLLVVFEHAIGVAVVNERILMGEGDGEPVFINTKNVLPEELTIITDTYGSQWPESVIKSEAGYVYGVDTVAKKIWRVKGQQIEILSDFKVNKFLIDNISLGERERYPIIGLKNVKTHYNNNKKDIMFTFYDDVYKDEEKVWNLCYNELLGSGTFTTFYSWIPSYSENIDTQYFSFDRNTSKFLTLLNKCSYANSNNTGVLLENPILLNTKQIEDKEYYYTNLFYAVADSFGKIPYTIKNEDGTTTIKEETIELATIDNTVKFKIEKDHWLNYKLVNEEELSNKILSIQTDAFENNKIITLYITPYFDNLGGITNLPTEIIALTTKDKLDELTTDFYLHGNSGIFNVTENLYPTHWYGEFHPFEFEFVVNDKIGLLKIFSNLEIISNKAEPESFHFEIEGDNYEFSSDKRTMYFRQEATKNLYQNLGSDMLFDRKYTDVAADNYTFEQYYRGNPKRRKSEEINENEYTNQYTDYPGFDKVYPIDSQGLVKQEKSTIFPLYYERVDKYNDIYHHYREMFDGVDGFDTKNLSGSEIKWIRDLNQFNIVTHIKNNPIDLVGRLRGNSRYKEGKWNIQIPSIIFNLKNESDSEWPIYTTEPWEFILGESHLNSDRLGKGDSSELEIPEGLKIPPIVVNSSNIPNDLSSSSLSESDLPSIYKGNKYTWPRSIDNSDWTYRKEAKIRDKWMKVRVRYKGYNLAIIHSLITLYNISYA